MTLFAVDKSVIVFVFSTRWLPKRDGIEGCRQFHMDGLEDI
jgi:hypothetical protein